MTLAAAIVLIGWMPIVAWLFATVPPARATIVAFVAGWLFLPVVGFQLPGLPDYSKLTAPAMAALIGGLLFASAPLLNLRLGRADLPIITWCLCYFASSTSNGLGLYNSLSMVLAYTLTYGLPYALGRAYLGDQRGVRDLAIGLVVGTLAYIPLCLFEVRFSPQLHRLIYGAAASRHAIAQSIRYGGYRPVVFMTHGLAVGIWMSAGAMIAWWLRSGRVARRVASGPLVLTMLVTAVVCKSTGAILLMALGMAILWASRRFNSVIPALVLAAIPPVYCGTRIAGLWSGHTLVSAAESVVGKDRAESLEFRLQNEDLLITRAAQRPIVGWGGWGRARVRDDRGNDETITDGWWIIAFGDNGLVGLTALIGVLILPLVILCRRCPPRRWDDPEIAPYAALAVLLALYMVDNIANAMFNPIFFLVAGALLSPQALDRDTGEGEEGGSESTRKIPDPAWLYAEEVEAAALACDRDWDEAARAWGRAADEAEHRGGPACCELATALGRQSSVLCRLGRRAEAIEACERALRVLSEWTGADPSGAAMTALAAESDALARLLTIAEDPADRNPARAVALASRAVRIAPGIAHYHSTLGAALIRSGRWSEAVVALGRSIALSPRDDSPLNHILLSIAFVGLGDLGAAKGAFDRANDLTHPSHQKHREVASLWREAATLISSAGGVVGPADHT